MKKSPPDPAIVSATAHRRALETLNGLGAADAEPTNAGAYHRAARRFADAVPTTPAGAIEKLREVLDCDFNDDAAQRMLSARHVRGVVAYLERLA